MVVLFQDKIRRLEEDISCGLSRERHLEEKLKQAEDKIEGLQTNVKEMEEAQLEKRRWF